jgi:hypothetical protein
MTQQLKFDTERYCRANAGRMGQWCGQDVAGLIAGEVHRLKMADDLNQQGAEHMRDEMQALRAHIAKLEAEAKALREMGHELAALKGAIRSAHPIGDDEGVDTMTVLRTLSNEWMGEMMRGPVSKIEFVDGEKIRNIIWEDGEADAGIPGAYIVTGDEPLYSDLTDELAALKEAARQTAEKDLSFLQELEENIDPSDITKIEYARKMVADWIEELAALVGEG